MTLIEMARPYAELLFFIAGIGLFVISVYGLRQIGLLKEDVRTRNVRAAREKAIEAVSNHTTKFIPEYNQLWRKWREAGLATYEGPVGTDFNFESLPKGAQAKGVERCKMTLGSDAFNTLETVAAYFTTGVADEEVGFRIIGRTYCATSATTTTFCQSITRGKGRHPTIRTLFSFTGLGALD
jgi:hypothetical protein